MNEKRHAHMGSVGIRKQDKLYQKQISLQVRLNELLDLAKVMRRFDIVIKVTDLLKGLKPIKKVLDSTEERLTNLELQCLSHAR